MHNAMTLRRSTAYAAVCAAMILRTRNLTESTKWWSTSGAVWLLLALSKLRHCMVAFPRCRRLRLPGLSQQLLHEPVLEHAICTYKHRDSSMGRVVLHR